MKIPVTITSAPDFADPQKVQSQDQAEIRDMVNAVFEFMVEHGTPCDEDFQESGDYGPDLEPYRESLTRFMTAWHNLAFAYDDCTIKGVVTLLPRKVGRWKLWLLRVLFKPHKVISTKHMRRDLILNKVWNRDGTNPT